MVLADWFLNIGSYTLDNTIYISGKSSLKLTGSDMNRLTLVNPSCTNLPEGMIETWLRYTGYSFAMIFFRKQSLYEGEDIPSNTYWLSICTDSQLYEVWKRENESDTMVGGSSTPYIPPDTWFAIRLQWFKGMDNSLVIVVELSEDGSTWTRLGSHTDESPSFEGSSINAVAIGCQNSGGQSIHWYDLTKIYRRV